MPVSRKRTKKHRSPSSQASRNRQRINKERKRQMTAEQREREYFNKAAQKMGLPPLFETLK